MFSRPAPSRGGVPSSAHGGAVMTSALQMRQQETRKTETQLACQPVHPVKGENRPVVAKNHFVDADCEDPVRRPDENTPPQKPQMQAFPATAATRPASSGSVQPPSRLSPAPQSSGAQTARQTQPELCSWSSLPPLCSERFSSFAPPKSDAAHCGGERICECMLVYNALVQRVAAVSEHTPEPCSASVSTAASTQPPTRVFPAGGEDWEADVTLLTALQSVAKHHPSWLYRSSLLRSPLSGSPPSATPPVSSLCVFIASRTQSLRSIVARSALRTAATLFRASRLYRSARGDTNGVRACHCSCPCCGVEGRASGREGRCCATARGEPAEEERPGKEPEEAFWTLCDHLLPILLAKAGARDKKFLAMEAEDALDIIATCVATAESSSLLSATVEHLRGHLRSVRTMAAAARLAQKVAEQLLETRVQPAKSAGAQPRACGKDAETAADGQCAPGLASQKRPRTGDGALSSFPHAEFYCLPVSLLPLLLAFARAQHAPARKAARCAIVKFAKSLLPCVPHDGELTTGNSDWKVQQVLEWLQTLLAEADHSSERKRAKGSGAHADEASVSCQEGSRADKDSLRLLAECVRSAVADCTVPEGKPTLFVSPRMPLFKRRAVANRQGRKSVEVHEFAVATRVSLPGETEATVLPRSTRLTGGEPSEDRLDEMAREATPEHPEAEERAEKLCTAAASNEGIARSTTAPSSLCHRQTVSSEVVAGDFKSSS
ncbi:conserved hypothetical protein [Neospora caninum Liverpool]|uniref:Uncharacterized protein n=1 Tax=Neospora caninum (strain Liverpool) TaxID=572307 RepID=F0V998_NEOCL|nr:conserved hypothetical protein [Neospora caninum Liverpool]CBZ50323.1 conserved hypothetical protein [Neospora caninum Liverpool]CEL64929.1 TPA: hypothetical protein BN1204_007960 [Neospora caninum Liverpool]|eukprot:XP_003880357.1 conserved hypothetical protein [Neospora caninum Liverpool]